MKRIIILILYIASCIPVCFSFDFYFSRIDGKTGLSHNHVKAIVQDSYGFMWFGTRNRLNRYDGISLKVFDCYDFEKKKGNNNISALFEDPDKKLWIGTDNGIFVFDPIKEKFYAFDLKTEDGIEITEWIADVQLDLDNNMWIVTPNQGVFKYDRTKNKLHRYTVVEDLKPSISNPQCIAIEKNGRIWIGSNGSGIYLYDKTTDSFTQYLGDKEENKYLEGKNIYTICHHNDYLIVGVHEGKLMKLDKRRNILLDMSTPDVNFKIIRSITVLNDDELWIGTHAGLFVIDEKNQKIAYAMEDVLNAHSLSDKIVEKVYKDREGGIWIGTTFGGVNYLPNRNSKFEKYFPSSTKLSITSKRVRELYEDENGTIWIGFENAGATTFDPERGEFRPINKLYDNKTLALHGTKNKIWIGYFKNGLDILTYPQNTITHYSAEKLGLNEESIYALCEDRNGRVWLGNAWGVFVANKDEMKFKRMDIFGLSYTYDIIEDSDGHIWVATIGNGVFQYDQKNDKITHHTATTEKDNGLSSNSVSSITEDHLGQIWFSTDRGGICVYNKKNNKFKTYSTAEGLPDDITYRILEDKNYDLWFGTNKGLVRFNPEANKIRVFTQNDGLLSDQFNYKSGLISSSGKLYFGCMDGLIAFKPEDFKDNKFIPPVYITKLSIYNEEMEPNTHNSPLKKSIIHTKKIKIPYTQSNISFNFVSLSYTAPLANTYAYKMEDIDKDWVYTQNNHSASYAKLPSGKYVFRVKGSNNDGLWNEEEASIEIEIMPPWWASGIAYLIYLLLFIFTTYLVLRFSLKKYQKRNNEKQKLFEIEKEKELYEAKVSFFTDIAHEIRTPVTLINGPLESILEMDISDKKVKHHLKIIENNTNHLLTLINQLLDFRKVDNSKFLLSFRKTDISLLLKDTISRFEEQLSSKKKTINIKQDIDYSLSVIADKDALSKIVNNLFSNAIKYSNNLIEIDLSMDETYLTIQVVNDGELIASEYRDKIFEPFFQIKSAERETSGSGIGLVLARSLAELHNGYLFYDCQSGMNVFILKIPIRQNVEIEESNIEPLLENDISEEQKDFTQKQKRTKTILVVEDNTEMLKFIHSKLCDTYLVEKASDGIEAQKILAAKSIDIVISDVMMPKMDGYELCSYIKSNSEYSRIIVILLTAKNDLKSKIKGLEIGADAYAEKPFSFNYLLTLLASLLNNRQRDIELFMKKPFIPMQQGGLNKADEQFLNRAIDIINENITDSEFNVERLADAMFLSRSSLHRKLKSITNSTPIDFIRLVRLQRAVQYLIEGEYRINEICYLVGINTPSYFIKLFQNQYGMTPKEFEMKNRNS